MLQWLCICLLLIACIYSLSFRLNLVDARGTAVYRLYYQSVYDCLRNSKPAFLVSLSYHQKLFLKRDSYRFLYSRKSRKTSLSNIARLLKLLLVLAAGRLRQVRKLSEGFMLVTIHSHWAWPSKSRFWRPEFFYGWRFWFFLPFWSSLLTSCICKRRLRAGFMVLGKEHEFEVNVL